MWQLTEIWNLELEQGRGEKDKFDKKMGFVRKGFTKLKLVVVQCGIFIFQKRYSLFLYLLAV